MRSFRVVAVGTLVLLAAGCSILSYIAPPKNGDGDRVGKTVDIYITKQDTVDGTNHK